MSSISEREIGQIDRFLALSGIDRLLPQNGAGPVDDQTGSIPRRGQHARASVRTSSLYLIFCSGKRKVESTR
jgi:hypothetical protein